MDIDQRHRLFLLVEGEAGVARFGDLSCTSEPSARHDNPEPAIRQIFPLEQALHLLHATNVAGDSLLIEKLPPRERQVFDAVCAQGEASAADLESLLPDPPSNSAIRIMLSRLEKKGFVTHKVIDQRYVYSVALPEQKVKQTALQHLIQTLFNGSSIGAAAALIGMSERVKPEELDQLEELIAKARRENS
ncbi:MAG TPA: BlaI/MecI/CopY family transcriptional regulator [Allosphingosinicella sp.]